MFLRDSTDSRRVLIVDVMGLCYRFAYGGAKGLSTTLSVGGILTRVDTTIPTYVIKQIYRWSKGGVYPTIVCFDGAGSTRSRKAYFTKCTSSGGTHVNVDYKEGRDVQDSRFYDGVNLTMNLLLNGGVCCLKAEGYEADDLIKASVDKAKVDYPHLPIDVITGDADLAPLVDEQVSVFLYSRKSTWAESKDLEKNHYVQLTPDNYQTYIESLTNYKNLSVPYNTLLLTKCLRGDKSDGIPGYPKFTPTKYNNLISQLENDGYDLSSLCYYDNPIEVVCYRGTEEPIPVELIDTTPFEMKMIKYMEPPCITRLCSILEKYLDEPIINHVRMVYNGINLNCAYTNLPNEFKRRPAKLRAEIKGYLASKLQASVALIQVNLPIL